MSDHMVEILIAFSNILLVVVTLLDVIKDKSIMHKLVSVIKILAKSQSQENVGRHERRSDTT